MQSLKLVIMAGCFMAPGIAQAGDSRQTSRVGSVSFRLATTRAADGFDRMAYDGKQILVSSAPSFSGADIRSVETTDTSTSLQLELTLEAAANLALQANRAQADQLAVLVGSRIVAMPTLVTSDVDGSTLLAGLSSGQVDRLVALLSREGVAYGGPVMSAISSLATVRAGDTFTVDTYVSGIADLGAFQVGLVISGGTTGELIVEDVDISDSRGDFVFDPSAVTVTDKTQFRAVGAMMQGGVDAEELAYLATYSLRASHDASGTFYVNILPGDGSLLRDSDALAIPYLAGKDLIVTVGKTNARARYSR